MTPDADFAVARTSPTFGDDLESGEVIALAPRESKVMVAFEIWDGVLDADPVTSPTPSTVEIVWEYVTISRVRGEDSYTVGIQTTTPVTKRGIETELHGQGLGFIRLVSAVNLAGTGAVVVLIDEGVS